MYPDSHKWKFPIKTIWYDEKEIEDDDGDISFTQTTTRRTQKDHRRRIWRCYWFCYGYLELGQEGIPGATSQFCVLVIGKALNPLDKTLSSWRVVPCPTEPHPFRWNTHLLFFGNGGAFGLRFLQDLGTWLQNMEKQISMVCLFL